MENILGILLAVVLNIAVVAFMYFGCKYSPRIRRWVLEIS